MKHPYFMTEYTCGNIFGSLVHRAQGYKRLRDEIIMSKYRSSSFNTNEDRMYALVTRNTPVQNVMNPRDKITILFGDTVLVNKFEERRDFLQVIIISDQFEFTQNIIYERDVYLCPSDVLIAMEKNIWNLIAAIPSPEERIRIIKDDRLLSELTSIEEGSIVKVPKLSVNGIVTDILSVPRLGPGIFFEVELFVSIPEECFWKLVLVHF